MSIVTRKTLQRHDRGANTVVILAGGKSTRFRRDKTLLKLDGARLLIETIVDRCRGLFDEILIMSNRENKFGIEGTAECSDLFPNLGPIGGIHGGLRFMKGERALVAACDMPFFDIVLAEKMLALSDGCEAVVPRDGEWMQPLFAVYTKSSLPVFEAHISRGTKRPLEVIRNLRTRYIDRDEWEVMEEHKGRDIFYNINCQKDLLNLNVPSGSTHG
jgi:molybdopterin-guanine dinucleotide biosynthesis protein A